VSGRPRREDHGRITGAGDSSNRRAQSCASLDMAGCPETFRSCLFGLLEAAPGLVMVSNCQGRVLYMNRTGRSMLGLEPQEDLATRTVQDFYTRSAYEHLVQQSVPECLMTGTWRGESRLVGGDGREIPVSQLLMAHETKAQDERGCAVLSSIAWDLSEQKRTEGQLWHRATHDVLTGLPNRDLLLDRLAHALHAAQRHNHFVAVLFLDCDDFKLINDALGHEAGDRFLRALAGRLQSSVRAEDTVARYGGDEFVLLVPDLRRERNFLQLLDKIERALQEPFIIHGKCVYAAASVGVALYPDDGREASVLLQKADSMMYRIKRRSRKLRHVACTETAPGRLALNPL
jgi:diguanylate cyclase (GGDEF)-like protein/PAS domain S-box-containing protein